MSRKFPPLPALSAFEAVARHRSFSLAAQELSVTRSAISHRIKALEEYFNAQLFFRHRAVAAITPRGRILLDAVTEALSTIETSCQRLSGNQYEVVHISAGLAFASAWLMARLPAFHRKHRNIEFEISALRITTHNKLACLQSGEADIVISHGVPADWIGFEYFEIVKCHVFPVCSRGYYNSIGGLDSPQSILKKASMLRLFRHPWRPWFKSAGVVCDEPDRGPLFSHAGLMIEAAVNGHGVALVRDVLVGDELKSGRLIKIGNTELEDSYYAVYQLRAMTKNGVVECLHWLGSFSQADRPSKLAAIS